MQSVLVPHIIYTHAYANIQVCFPEGFYPVTAVIQSRQSTDVFKRKKKANKQNKQIDAYECVDAYHIYEIPRQLLLK